MPTIVIIAPDQLYANSLSQLVAWVLPGSQPEIFRTAGGALEYLTKAPVPVVLTELAFPDMPGLDLVRCILSRKLATRLFVITSRTDERTRQLLADLRVHGVFNPAVEEVPALLDMLRGASGPGRPAARPALVPAPARSAPQLRQLFSATELRVFAVIGDGCDDGEAALVLQMSPNTVHSHRQRIMRKLSVHTRTGLMREAIRRGVIQITPERVWRPGFQQPSDAIGDFP